MKKVAGVLLAGLMLMPISPVYASESTTSGSTESSASATVALPQLYQLNYDDIQKVILERNPTVKTNMDLVNSADNGYLSINDAKGDVGSTIGSLSRRIKALKAQVSGGGLTPDQIAAIQVQIKGYQGQIASLGSTVETLENNEEDTEKAVAQAKVNVEMGNQQIFLGTQNLFFAKDALDNQQKGLEDNIAYLTQKNSALTLQRTLGLVSDLDVSTFNQQIKDLNYQLDLVKEQQNNVRGQVNLLVGQEFNHPLELTTGFSFNNNTAPTAQNYSKDLATVTAKSYTLKLQKMQIDAKELALSHSEETDGLDSYGYKKAQADLDAEKTKLEDVNKKIKQQFDQAYNDVQDKQSAAQLEESRLNDLQTKLKNAQLSNQVGTLSNLDLEGVKVEYNSQVLKAQNAQEDLMKANNVYQWLLKGVSAPS